MPATVQAVGAVAVAATGNASVTPTNPAHQPSDILLLVSVSRGATTDTITTPTGWTAIGTATSIGTIAKAQAFILLATSSSEANPACTWNNTVGEKIGQVHVVRSAEVEGSLFGGSAAIGTVVDPPVCGGVTTTTPSELVVVFGITLSSAATAGVTTSTDPASYTQNGWTAGTNCQGFMFSATRTAIGATGNITVDPNAAAATGTFIRALSMRNILPRVPMIVPPGSR